ncbi:MAG: cytochrome c [Paracoccaceae bacterium]|jgi:cytochrome c55X
MPDPRPAALALSLLALSAGAAPADVSGPRARELEHMVIQDCGSCHGLTRKGGLGSPLTPQALAHAEPDGLAAIILDGVPETAMPPWRPLLTEEEALWIANYLLKVTP